MVLISRQGKTPDVSDIAADFSLSVKWQTLYIHLARSGQFNIENGHRKKKEKNNYHFLNIVANKKKYISFKKEA